MNLADLSIKRPVFVSAVVAVLFTLGLMALSKLPVDLFPDVTLPVVTVTTAFPGAGPAEVETLVSKVLEDEISTVTGIKNLSSVNNESLSTVVAEFTLETDIAFAEQQIRDKVSAARPELPDDVEEPVIRRIDPADQPILILSLSGDLSPAQLYNIADNQVQPQIEQVNQVGLVEIIGGRRREIRVALDRDKLRNRELSATAVAQRIEAAGQNVPAGAIEKGPTETMIRTVGEFDSLSDIGNVVLSFFGNEVPITVDDVGEVVDTLEDETSRAYHNGEQSVFLMVFRQSGANTIAVVEAVKERLREVNVLLAEQKQNTSLEVVLDGARPIRANVDDVEESILIGILLTILVVYFFLGSGRSTFITGLALPNSLIGAFFIMFVAGFSINVMTLLAMSLAVGLLIDDAIVVRENIFRHTEMGTSPVLAASQGTKEVMLAVVATTLSVVAVFAPIGFISGVVGQFLKEFGLTVCFAMMISLFDAVTMAPMLSAYFAGRQPGHGQALKGIWGRTMGRVLHGFDQMQKRWEESYVRVLGRVISSPLLVLAGALIIFLASIWSVNFIPKTFLPAQDTGEFSISLEMPPGTSIDAMTKVATQVDAVVRGNEEVASSVMFIGGRRGESNTATFFVTLVESDQRDINTNEFKAMLRHELKDFAVARPVVKDIDIIGGGMRPFSLNIVGADLDTIETVADKVAAKLRNHPALIDVDTSHRQGKPEFQVVIDQERAERLGVAGNIIGLELRNQVEGTVPAVFRESGEEYNIRVRLQSDQRNIQEDFEKTFVPNMNQTLVRLRDIAEPIETTGPSSITRQNRARYIQISADINPNGPGLAAVMEDIERLFETEIRLPPGVSYRYVGQAEGFQEMISSIILAGILGIIFIYLVLASLYESYITPFTILLVLPLAACGAFFALLITKESLNIFSMIGCLMLLGIATKNSILLVDYANQRLERGESMRDAMIAAGRVRLRPILMTTFALIAGMLPIAIGLNEAARQRTSMGIAVVGGLISSTLLTLVVVPAAYSYFERFRRWSLHWVKRKVGNVA